MADFDGEVWSENGYPTDEFLAWLESTTNARAALDQAAGYFNACGYGSGRWTGRTLTLVTGGWSGCEDVLTALEKNWNTARLFESMHRGGKWVYELEEG